MNHFVLQFDSILIYKKNGKYCIYKVYAISHVKQNFPTFIKVAFYPRAQFSYMYICMYLSYVYLCISVLLFA